ncbi:hypothetical protein [Rhodococcoides kyotonense]|uniref:Propionate CoA-transferase n=1 Tax=Rhodococcoides kyotonense TaxID=398843 RepID=A0A239MZV7_9NOCA|nr:hypothetical protein [Rhodococcus kyotonensis]SNT47763.1 propionate CoA-transferase [Rhodococcus kyotonensis]
MTSPATAAVTAGSRPTVARMAARSSNGTVIAEVNRIIPQGELPARMARVPGAMVDIVVLSTQDVWEDEQDAVLLGTKVVELAEPAPLSRPRDVIAALALRLVGTDAVVNLGAGIPMYDVPEAARRSGRQDLYFTVEQGPMGGWPAVGGVARNPECVLSQSEVFDFYEGGGPDVSILSFGEISRHGDVNVSRFGKLMPGCGGFVNIAHGARHLIFCGTLTAGGLSIAIGEGRMSVTEEGRIGAGLATASLARIRQLRDGAIKEGPATIALQHPSGVMDIQVDATACGEVAWVAVTLTARRIFAGIVDL